MKNRIVIIDDEPELLDIMAIFIQSIFGDNIEIEAIPNWKQYHSHEGDIVLHDLNGVGELPAYLSLSVKCISLSGDLDLSPDLQKPFDFEDLQRVISKVA